MRNSVLQSTTATQIGIIVHDIQEASERFAGFLGVEVPQVIQSGGSETARAEYHGEPCDAHVKLAFFYMGPLEIELIEPDHNPSTWREYLDKNGEGIHHIAFEIKGMAEQIAQMENHDMKLIQKGEFTGGRYAYMDAASSLKTIVELLEHD